MIKLKSKKTRMGIMLFLVPALVIYLVFQIIPIICSIYFSLVDWGWIYTADQKSGDAGRLFCHI